MDTNRSLRTKYLESMLKALFESNAAGAMLGPDGVTVGIPNWHERTADQRPSERITTHGYPFGFAKSQWHLRDKLIQRFRIRLKDLGTEQKHDLLRVHEAVARALDTERLLGSFNYDGDDHFPVETIDRVADNLLLWLDHQGYRVVPKEGPADDEPLPEVASSVPTIFDTARGALLLVREQGDNSVEASDGQDQDESRNEEANVESSELTATGPTGIEESPESGGGRSPANGYTEECPLCEGAGCEVCANSGWLSQEEIDALPCPECGGRGCPECLETRGCDLCDGRGCEFCDHRGWIDLEELDAKRDKLHSDGTMTCFECWGTGELAGDTMGASICPTCYGTGQDSIENVRRYIEKGAQFSGFELSGGDLSGLDLSAVVLDGADLTAVDFAGTDLTDADLTGAELTGANPEAASSLKGTKLLNVVGLTGEQMRACRAKGAVVVVDEAR